MRKFFEGALLTGSMVALLMGGSPSIAWADHSWSNYHWARTGNPIPLQVIDSVSNDWKFEFQGALADWNNNNVLDMSVTSTDDSDRSRKRCKMQLGQIRVCNAEYGFRYWLGLATIGIDANGHIDQGTAQMNDSWSSYWANPNEKRHVMCQEIGHLFGLGHTSEDGSSQGTCMDYSSDPNSVSPNAHDYQLLVDKYAHPDSYNSYDDGSSGSGDTGDDKPCNPRKPNCTGYDLPDGIPPGAVLMNRGPHSETWVKGRGDGGLWIIHVRLAPEGRGKK